jgi:hypothetical protein
MALVLTPLCSLCSLGACAPIRPSCTQRVAALYIVANRTGHKCRAWLAADGLTRVDQHGCIAHANVKKLHAHLSGERRCTWHCVSEKLCENRCPQTFHADNQSIVSGTYDPDGHVCPMTANPLVPPATFARLVATARKVGRAVGLPFRVECSTP